MQKCLRNIRASKFAKYSSIFEERVNTKYEASISGMGTTHSGGCSNSFGRADWFPVLERHVSQMRIAIRLAKNYFYLYPDFPDENLSGVIGISLDPVIPPEKDVAVTNVDFFFSLFCTDALFCKRGKNLFFNWIPQD